MSTDYDASNIRVMDGLEGVRCYPGMYIGSTDARGLHHLVYEVVDNSIEEALAGHCKNIDVSIHANGSITVIDDGRGIESERNNQTDELLIAPIFTTLHFGKYRDCDYRIGGGLYGVGLAVVSALSAHVEVKVWHDGKTHSQRFERGIAGSELEISPSDDHRTGTSITFLPDLAIFTGGIEVDFDILADRLQELAYLNAGIQISLTDDRLKVQGIKAPKTLQYHYPGGLWDYVAHINRDKQPLHEEVIYTRAEQNQIRVEVALQWWIDAEDDCILGFANTVRTIDGGMHLDGLKIAVARTINQIARQQNKLQPDDADLGGEYICQGLTAIVSLLLPNPEWAGPIRTKLVNTQLRGLVDSIVSEALTKYLAAHPNIADAIITRAINNR